MRQSCVLRLEAGRHDECDIPEVRRALCRSHEGILRVGAVGILTTVLRLHGIQSRNSMKRSVSTVALVLALTTVLSAAVKFTSTWKSNYAGTVSFAGKKVAALVISGDDSLRVAGEEALARELSERGMQGVSTYRIAPKEELQTGERAKPWFERAGVEGVVALRPVAAESRSTYTPGTWVNPYYSTLWGYYNYGWTSLYIPGSKQHETVVTVETTIYSVPRNELLWAAVTETRDPKNLPQFIEELVKESVKQMQKQGLARSQPK
jgi:hypothetical protein